jgi:hypothetical protein
MLPRECRWLLGLAGLIVPSDARASWRRRHEAELWYRELETRRAGKSDTRIRAAVAASACASFADAWWQRFDRERLRAALSLGVRSPRFCLIALALLLVCITAASDGLTRTRRILKGAGFANGDRVVAVCIQELLMGRRQGVTPAAVQKWREQARSLEQIASYTFSAPWYTTGFLLHRGPAPARLPHALVSPEFFSVLGVQALRGRLFTSSDAGGCGDCIVVTQHLKRELLRTSEAVVGRTVDYEGRRWRIIGELPEDFWFMTQKLGGITLMDAAAAKERVVGLGLLRRGVPVESAEAELRQVARLPVIEVVALSHRLRAPLGTFGLGSVLLLALVALASGAGIVRTRSAWRFWSFFFAKTALAATAVLLFAIDYGGAGQLSITGGNRPNEPVAFWIWITGTVLCVWWSIADQKMRCRNCQRRLVLPVRIGSNDRVLFEHESLEMVCPGGHGTLYVEGVTETFRQEGRWTKLDESWHDLFVEKQ